MIPLSPDNRGRLLNAAQVAEVVFNKTVSTAWVRRMVPGKIVLGHSTVRWYELDVLAWVRSRQELDSTYQTLIEKEE